MYTVVKRGQVYQPTVSGNGKVVAWRDLPKPGVSEIGIKREGEEAELFTNSNQAVANPSLDYDGDVVIWEVHSGKNYPDWDIARQGPEDDGPVVILDTEGRDVDADISSDGSKVVVGHWSKSHRERSVDMWTKGEGTKTLSPEGMSSGLPIISGDGERVFYLQIPGGARVPNEIWMQESDGTEKPVVYEQGANPPAKHKQSFDTNEDGSVLAWSQKEGMAPTEIYRWDLKNGVKELIDECPRGGQVNISADGSTMAWTTTERNDQGQWESQLHWRRGDEEKIVAADTVGLNTYPSLSDDGSTLVWMWKNPKINFDHEIRQIVLQDG